MNCVSRSHRPTPVRLLRRCSRRSHRWPDASDRLRLYDKSREILHPFWPIGSVKCRCCSILCATPLPITPTGGIVSITLDWTAADRLVLSVADTGIGIAPADLERVFDQFYRSDASRTRTQGTSGGFGLRPGNCARSRSRDGWFCYRAKQGWRGKLFSGSVTGSTTTSLFDHRSISWQQFW